MNRTECNYHTETTPEVTSELTTENSMESDTMPTGNTVISNNCLIHCICS